MSDAYYSPIYFYTTRDDFWCGTNFSPHTTRVGKFRGATSEHVFQAFKFITTDMKYARAILVASGPGEAARLGRDRSKPLRPDWEGVKDDVMRLVVWSKYTQNPDCKTLLLSTGVRPLVEHTERDRYWGDGGNGSGRNMLGIILVEVRSILRKPDEDQSAWLRRIAHLART